MSRVRVLKFARTSVLVACVLVSTATGCRRGPQISPETHRQAVTAFYVALAALQTSQDVHARQELDRLIQLLPNEPAGWANLGLLLLRQQQMDEAAQRLTRASELAPDHAAIVRLVALSESLRGNLEESVRHWRRAMQLDAGDQKAPYALAQELERLGGPANEADAHRVLEQLAARTGNLAAQLELARLSAKRGDAAVLAKTLETLAQRSASWPADARDRLNAVPQTARDSAAAARSVIFLKNVLIREPEYRSALAAVSTPRSEVGEPLLRLVSLPNPAPEPEPPDEQLTFSIETLPHMATPGTSWAGAIWLTGEGRPTVVAAGPRDLRLDSGITVSLRSGAGHITAAPDAVAAADLNYDFRTDIVLAGSDGLEIYRQDAKGVFAIVAAGVPADVSRAPMHAAWPADLDTDGDLDLVLGLRDGPATVLRNNGDGTFTTQPWFASVLRLRAFVWADFDGEGVPDAALIDDRGVLRIFINLRGAEFREIPVPAQVPPLAAAVAAELTGDGGVDMAAISTEGTLTRLSIRPGGGTVEAARLIAIDPPPGLAPGTTRLLSADLDNNGAGDFVISTPSGSRIVLSGRAGSLFPLANTLPEGITSAADLDGDGRVDLVARADDGVRVVRNQGLKGYHWQAIRPRAVTATGDQRINSFGIGGEIEVRTGLHAQKQVISSPVVHFGLGKAHAAEVARVTWPNGVLQSEFDLPVDASVGASQRLKGSCPWLFAWDGSEMHFVTDFIWRSPLGLRINAQATADVAMTEDWVRIRGDQLKPRNGEYDLRITAELWETHFFDLLSLLVVDHPQGTEVFVDERFAVPPPRLGVIATAPVQPFASARDDTGRDAMDLVQARDDRHLDFAGRGAYQGVTRDHHVEIELPADAPRTGPLWLVAQGWIHPTDSSINVALGQGQHPQPTGLSLHVADAAGRFRVARTGLGFPAGKDKTILIDLAGLFPAAGPRRLRLATNLEIFWDRLGWAAGRPDVRLEPRRLTIKRAELRFRGYSVTEQKDASTPERPRYVIDGVAGRWRDLEGYHTRFGDVRELLLGVDDRYVIMNAGDELQVTFPEAPAPRPGMVRDFVLVGDGWEKDGDYNTVASRTVLPLPTHRTPVYNSRPGRLEDDPVYRRHRADFERYHTRYVSPDAVRDALRVK